MIKQDRYCLVCGKLFHPPRQSSKYCSRKCYFMTRIVENKESIKDKNWRFRHRLNKKCPVCGVTISDKASHCVVHQTFPDRSLEKNIRWRGGRWKTRQGYTRISIGKGQSVREHRLVWEQAHNKKLPKGWLVHHLNGIRDDNRLENLMAMSRKDHPQHTYIKALQARIRELEQLHMF